MLTFQSFSLGALGTNCYVLTGADRTRAVVIDPGAPEPALLRKLEGLQVEAILLTHAHFDHIGGVDAVRRAHGCPVYLHPLESRWLTDPARNSSLLWPEVTGPISTDPAEHELADGDRLSLLGETFEALHLPGHSPGSVGFLCGDWLFGGDVLFRRSVGRTDLPGGDGAQLMRSIRDKLFALPDAVTVFPGHGPETTIGEEKAHNPYVKG